jgi:hypothetical protein
VSIAPDIPLARCSPSDDLLREARRHNALLKSTAALSEPLRPLLRPYPIQSPSPTGVPSVSLTTPTSQTQTLVPSSNMPPVPAPTPTTTSRPAIVLPEEGEAPTPSPLFPRNIADLFAMGPDDARKLVADYGLVEDIPHDSPGSSSANNRSPESPADTQDIHLNLNRFMAHIGVRSSEISRRDRVN